jgi:RNA polymerase sigma-70 factor (ECF subfamily)
MSFLRESESSKARKPAEAPPLRAQTVSGDSLSREELFTLVYDELHGLARRNMLAMQPGHTLQPTALVNELYLKLAKQDGRTWNSREHFLHFAARAMRHVLVDHSRSKNSAKRSPIGERVALDEIYAQFDERSIDLLALDDGLEALEKLEPRLVEIVDLHFFGGCTLEEISRALDIPLRSTQRDWQFARNWLHHRLSASLE